MEAVSAEGVKIESPRMRYGEGACANILSFFVVSKWYILMHDGTLFEAAAPAIHGWIKLQENCKQKMGAPPAQKVEAWVPAVPGSDA